MTVLAVLLLLSVIIPLVAQAVPALNAAFLFGRAPGSIAPEAVNSVTMVAISAAVSFPLALLAGLYRVEFARPSRWTQAFDQFTGTMLSVPSIVVGLVVVDVAVVRWHWPVSTLTGILALTLMNWPLTVALVVEALQSVPGLYRDGSWALGASRWQTVTRLILPLALPQMIEQGGMAVARLMGETAVLIYTAGVNVGPGWALGGPGESLAVHLWLLRTEGVTDLASSQAAATGVVLLGLVFLVLWGSRRLAEWLQDTA